MPSLSSNIAASLDLAGSPASAAFPNILGRCGRVVNQVARAMMREARLGDQNQYLRFLTLSSPEKEVAIPSISDPNSICTLELLTDDVNDSRTDIILVGRTELNAKEARGEYAAARFGRPTRLRFSWSPVDSSDTIYVGYENLPSLSESDMTSIPALPESFHDVLQYRTAALVMETILGKAPGPVFLDTMNKIETQWSEWCRRDAQEGPSVKPAFGTMDYGDPNGDWDWY